MLQEGPLCVKSVIAIKRATARGNEVAPAGSGERGRSVDCCGWQKGDVRWPSVGIRPVGGDHSVLAIINLTYLANRKMTGELDRSSRETGQSVRVHHRDCSYDLSQ
jgi:hypothetical protein